MRATAFFPHFVASYLMIIWHSHCDIILGENRERKLKNLNHGFLGLWIDLGAENFVKARVCVKTQELVRPPIKNYG